MDVCTPRAGPSGWHRDAANTSAAGSRLRGTGSWIFEHADFQAWSQENNSLLWLYGPPGTGKTVLCSAIVDDLQHRYRLDRSIAVLYFNFGTGNPGRITDLLWSLTVQMGNLVDELLLPAAARARENMNLAQPQEPLFKPLLHAVGVAMQKFRQIFVVIDGLDECSDTRRLITTLRRMMDWDLDGLHLFLSSRRSESLDAFLSTTSHHLRYIDITDFNVQDVVEFTIQKLAEKRNYWRGVEGDQNHLASHVVASVSGSFAGATLVLDGLRNAYPGGDIRTSLEVLPRDLRGYSRIFIDRYLDQPPPARKVLTWAGYARRPLRVEELAEAVAIDAVAVPALSKQERLRQLEDSLALCPELIQTVTIQTAGESYEGVTLVHDSLRDCLDHRLPVLDAHIEIARACLQYLCRLDKPDTLSSPDYAQQFPLANYAARFWHCHMQVADDPTHGHAHREQLDPLLSAAIAFLGGPGSSIYLQNWVRLFNPDRPWILQPDVSNGPPSVSTSLYYASCLGLPSLVRELLGTGKGNVNACCGAHGTALQAAAYHGHLAIVKLLLENGANPAVRCGLYGTALQAARFIGHADIADLLQAQMRETSAGEASAQDASDLDLPRHIKLRLREPDPYAYCEELGRGAVGYVDRVESLASGSLCARKTVRPSAEERRRVVKVVQLMEKLDHVHVVKVLGSYSTPVEFYILMEPVARWDLKRYLAGENGAVADARKLTRWLGCLARGLAYIHGKRVKHKDIKPSNLLVDGDNILYTDFDLAHAFQSLDDVTTGPTGQTVSYSAPEVASSGERTPATDVFSLGCVYVEMLTVIAGRCVLDIFNKRPGEKGYHFRGLNNARAVTWLEGLALGGEHETYGEAVRLTKLMISQDRPNAETLSRQLGSLACDLCTPRTT